MSEQLRVLWDAWRTPGQGPEALVTRQRARLAEQIAFARKHSPLYAELYRDVPDGSDDVAVLPITDKKKMMARFDDWCTDRAVTEAKVQAFNADLSLLGKRLLDKYTLITTSGTSGYQGIFIIDDHNMAVVNALALRALREWLSFNDFFRIVVGGPRVAMINAMGGHFASAVAATRLRGKRVEVFPVDLPLPEMVAKLNKFQPNVVASYASLAALLASEQEAGNLRISPNLLVLSAEGLPDRERSRIAGAFNTNVRDSYAASECMFISYRCNHGWLHVNSDWVILEPVDANHRPVPAGVQSHTVLVTNLANRVQPILRYELGDSILQRPNPCHCGSPLPAIRVQGRTVEILHFPGESGRTVAIPPLLFEALVDGISGVEQYQIVQTAPRGLRVRLKLSSDADRSAVWRNVANEVRRLLQDRGLSDVTVECGDEDPQQTVGGKYRRVIPLSH